MKNNVKITALVAIGLASVSVARAGTTDLLLGFNDAAGPVSAQNDYVIDLGLSGAALISAAKANNGTYDLSSTFNSGTFSTAFGTDGAALSDVAAGIVGGSPSGTKILYQTDLIGDTPGTITRGKFNASLADAQSPTIGEYASTTDGGWTTFIATSPTAGGTAAGGADLADNTGNPLGQLSAGVLSLNLWEATASGLSGAPTAWADEGTFNINLNNDTVTFSTAAVPEPSTYGLLAGVGLLGVLFRNQVSRKNA
jgi:hypothetical protein